MSSRITIKSHPGAGAGGLIAIIAGVIMILAGGATWGVVATQLANEQITVSQDAPFFQGALVQDPFTAFAQAEAINKHALEMSGNLTYAELDSDDPVRADVMNASFLRSSLFTSVVSFGVALLVIGAGLIFILVGWAIRRMTLSHPLVVETDSDVPVSVHNTKGKDISASTRKYPETVEGGVPVATAASLTQAEGRDTRSFTEPGSETVAGESPAVNSELDHLTPQTPLAQSTPPAASTSAWESAAPFATPVVVGTGLAAERARDTAPAGTGAENESVSDSNTDNVDHADAGNLADGGTQADAGNAGAQWIDRADAENSTNSSARAAQDTSLEQPGTREMPETFGFVSARSGAEAPDSRVSDPESDRIVYDPAVHGPAQSVPVVDTEEDAPALDDTTGAPSSQDATGNADSASAPSFDDLIADNGGGPLRLSRSERLIAESKNRRDLDNERSGLTGTIPIVGGVSETADQPEQAPAEEDDQEEQTSQDEQPQTGDGFDYTNRAQGWQTPQDRLK